MRVKSTAPAIPVSTARSPSKPSGAHRRRDDLRQRFQNEARAIARLQHPNIWAVFDVGEEGGVDYLVMEYLERETLEKQLERGPLPVSEALRIGAQIAAGLHAAHRAGIITHRDLIKPGNVMLTKSGASFSTSAWPSCRTPRLLRPTGAPS